MIRAWVQTHPERIELATQRLLPGLEGLSPELVVDDGPRPANPWRGYQACLRSFTDSESEWAVVLQDDTIVCRNFPPAVAKIVKSVPNHVIALFVGGGAIGRSVLEQQTRYSVIRNRFYVPCVALLWPREKASDILEWEKTAPTKLVPDDRSDDGFVGLWAKRKGEIIYATYPCLVEHPDDVPSVLIQDSRRRQARAQRGFDRKRVACEFIGMRRDPLELDW